MTNGIGSFSGSTVVGCNTRRYHSLLCAATMPPVGRVVTLSRVGELLKFDGSDVAHELSVNQFGGTFHPRGDRYLRMFHLGDMAQWDYQIEDVKIIKQLQLLKDRNTIGLRYLIHPGQHTRIEMQLMPFVAMRDFHALRHVEPNLFYVNSAEKQVSIAQGATTLYLQSDKGHFVPGQDWWRGHFYAIEAERGQDNTEDLFLPGRFTFQITEPTTITIWASTEPTGTLDWDSALQEQHLAAEKCSTVSVTIQKLNRAANDFIVARKNPDGTPGVTVIAGYPWFSDWGRDTMIALPGLFLTTGRFAEAAKVLSLFAAYVSEGMIPNRFDDYTNETSYNTVDASLWFIHACFEYLKHSKDSKLFEEMLLPACRAIVAGYSKGTRFGIKLDPADGLITQGDATTQLTWMDAKCGNVAFTPRQGKPVEINALWYNALELLGENQLANQVQKSFVKAFWISPFRGLCDGVDGVNRDMRIRPNQIFAVSLPHSPLNAEQQHAVVEVVRRELLTPYGLRTLAASDPQYQPKYTGDPFSRDRAYHNGTIWPWLIGPFLDAYLRVNNSSAVAMAQAKAWLQPLLNAMEIHGCIGQISEIYEAEAPHRPVGCFAQAWSVSEVLRIAANLGL